MCAATRVRALLLCKTRFILTVLCSDSVMKIRGRRRLRTRRRRRRRRFRICCILIVSIDCRSETRCKTRFFTVISRYGAEVTEAPPPRIFRENRKISLKIRSTFMVSRPKPITYTVSFTVITCPRRIRFAIKYNTCKSISFLQNYSDFVVNESVEGNLLGDKVSNEV